VTGAGIPVSSSWLDLREPADASARAQELAAIAAHALPGGDVSVIHDLGCGTGSMARWLAPQLPGEQRWVLHDRDVELLRIAETGALPSSSDGAAVSVQLRRSDIRRLEHADLAGASLITASALLDLMTHAELAGLVALCTSAGCPVLITLSVTGRVSLEPADPLDAAVAAAFNGHQRRRTGAGHLLGPDAVGAAVELFGRGPVDITVRPSPWRLGPERRELAAAWLDGWLAAACEQAPELEEPRADYASRRLAEIAGGRLLVTVDHADLLVLPR
jgi:hypothetical protein